MLNLGRFWELYEPRELGVVGQELSFLFTMIDLELRRSHPPPCTLTSAIEWGEGGRNQGKIVDGKRVAVSKGLKQLIIGADGFVSDSVRLEVQRLHSLYEECLYVLYTLVPDTSPAHYNIQQAMNEAESIDFNLFKWNHVCSSFAEAEQARKFEENSRVISQMMLQKERFTDVQIVRFLFSAYRRAKLDEWQKKEYFQKSFTNIFGNNKGLIDRLSGFFFSATTMPYECILAKVLALLPAPSEEQKINKAKNKAKAKNMKKNEAIMDAPKHSRPQQKRVKRESQLRTAGENSSTTTTTTTQKFKPLERTSSLSADQHLDATSGNATQRLTNEAERKQAETEHQPVSARRDYELKRKREENAAESRSKPRGNAKKNGRPRVVVVCKFGLNDPDGQCNKPRCSFKHLQRSRYRDEVCERRRCDSSCGKIYHNLFPQLRRRSRSPPAKRGRYSREPSSDHMPYSMSARGRSRTTTASSSRQGESLQPGEVGEREELIDSITKSVMKQFEEKLHR